MMRVDESVLDRMMTMKRVSGCMLRVKGGRRDDDEKNEENDDDVAILDQIMMMMMMMMMDMAIC